MSISCPHCGNKIESDTKKCYYCQEWISNTQLLNQNVIAKEEKKEKNFAIFLLISLPFLLIAIFNSWLTLIGTIILWIVLDKSKLNVKSANKKDFILSMNYSKIHKEEAEKRFNNNEIIYVTSTNNNVEENNFLKIYKTAQISLNFFEKIKKSIYDISIDKLLLL